MWITWRKSQSLGVPPSEVVGLIRGSYEAYCFDEVCWYAGQVIEADLEKAGQKPGKDQQKIEQARKAVLKKYFGDSFEPQQKFADPAALFGS